MTAKPLPDVELVRKVLDYDPETGILTWRRRPAELFESKTNVSQWNGRYAGKEAFTATDTKGYRHGHLFGRVISAHRVAWCIFHGEWAKEIDHINGNAGDNRIANLRSVTRRQNCQNRKLRIDCASGMTGVYWRANRRKWQANIFLETGHVYLGLFSDFEEAVAARKAAEVKYGFHPNHGRET